MIVSSSTRALYRYTVELRWPPSVICEFEMTSVWITGHVPVPPVITGWLPRLVLSKWRQPERWMKVKRRDTEVIYINMHCNLRSFLWITCFYVGLNNSVVYKIFSIRNSDNFKISILQEMFSFILKNSPEFLTVIVATNI